MNLKEYLKRAEKEKWAIGQFNFYNSKQLKAIVETAIKLKSPVILGTSERQSKIVGLKNLIVQVAEYKVKYGHPIFLHLDHGRSFEYIRRAIDAGYDSIHFDGSHLPLKENIEITKKVVSYAKKKNLPIEAEIEAVGNADKKNGAITEPKKVAEFIKKTKGIDTLAVTIGNVHGIAASGINPKLNLQKLKKIKKAAGKIPLVLHGGSGIRPSDIKGAVKSGIAKVNIATEIKKAKTILKIKKTVENKINLFQSQNKI